MKYCYLDEPQRNHAISRVTHIYMETKTIDTIGLIPFQFLMNPFLIVSLGE